jgi:hypothetical protein
LCSRFRFVNERLYLFREKKGGENIKRPWQKKNIGI